MSNWLIFLCYILAAYGFSNMMVFGSGPFRIFEWIRYLTNKISDHFGTMFTCMMCFPANLGIICSLINWFFIPVAITPFNMMLSGHTGLWWLAMLGDCALTSGSVWFIHHIEEYFENKAESNNIEIEDVEQSDIITVDDITVNGRNGKKKGNQ